MGTTNRDATKSGLNQFHDKSRDVTAAATGPISQGFHKLGQFGESTVGKAFGGGETGNFVGQAAFDPIGAGLSLLGGGKGRQRDVADIDPNQAARLREIDRTRKQISTGTDALTQTGIQEIRKAGETTKGQLAKFSGGDVGGTIASFLRAQRNTNKGVNERFSQGQARIPFFENLSTQLGNRMSQRKLELDVHRADQDAAERAQAQTTANLNESGRQAFEGDTGGLSGAIKNFTGQQDGQQGGGLLSLVQGQGGLSNVVGGGQGFALGQGGSGVGGGLLESVGIGGGRQTGQGFLGAIGEQGKGLASGVKDVFGSGGGGNAGGFLETAGKIGKGIASIF